MYDQKDLDPVRELVRGDNKTKKFKDLDIDLPFFFTLNCSSTALVSTMGFAMRRMLGEYEKLEYRNVKYFKIKGGESYYYYNIHKGNLNFAFSEKVMKRYIDFSEEKSESFSHKKDGVTYNPLFYLPKQSFLDLGYLFDDPKDTDIVVGKSILEVIQKHFENAKISFPSEIVGHGFVSKEKNFKAMIKFKNAFKEDFVDPSVYKQNKN